MRGVCSRNMSCPPPHPEHRPHRVEGVRTSAEGTIDGSIRCYARPILTLDAAAPRRSIKSASLTTGTGRPTPT